MKVDIWSDIRCPFCYIGKRKFEMALAGFAHKDEVEVTWHSFELEPGLVTEPGKSTYDYLAERKGMSRAAAIQALQQMTATAAEVGLAFDFDKAVVANSFDGHRLIHLAKSAGLGNEGKERMLKAYYTEGANIDDRATLQQLGEEMGLDATAVSDMLQGDAFAADVRKDEATAQANGINGVPFFVFNGKYAVSGAQPPSTFLETLEYAWKEGATIKSAVTSEDGEACSIDGNNC